MSSSARLKWIANQILCYFHGHSTLWMLPLRKLRPRRPPVWKIILSTVVFLTWNEHFYDVFFPKDMRISQLLKVFTLHVAKNYKFRKSASLINVFGWEVRHRHSLSVQKDYQQMGLISRFHQTSLSWFKGTKQGPKSAVIPELRASCWWWIPVAPVDLSASYG